MNFTRLREFDKDLKKLKKYRTLNEDMKTLEKILKNHPRGYPPAIVRITDLGIQTEIYKVRHFRCKYLNRGSRSGIRVIYAYFEESQKIEFIEIYYKDDQENEDRDRIRRHYK